MIEFLNWMSTNPKLTLGILFIIGCFALACVSEYAEHKYGERY